MGSMPSRTSHLGCINTHGGKFGETPADRQAVIDMSAQRQTRRFLEEYGRLRDEVEGMSEAPDSSDQEGGQAACGE